MSPPKSLDERVYGQPLATKLLTGMLRQGSLHHALFFHGPPHTGKTTLARELVKTLFCQAATTSSSASQPPSNTHACGQCTACAEIEEGRFPLVFEITSDDRMPIIQIVRRLQQNLARRGSLESSGESSANTTTGEPTDSTETTRILMTLLRSECSRLIARHRHGILAPLKRKKVSYPEGVVLSEKEIEKRMHAVYSALEQAQIKNDLTPLLSEPILANIRDLQNSLDRTFMSTASMAKALAWSEQAASGRLPSPQAAKTVIIKGVEKIHHTAIGRFLKILEDPTPQTRFILIANDLSALNQAVTAPLLSRCFKIRFTELDEDAHANIFRERFAWSDPPRIRLTNFFANAMQGSETLNASLQSKLMTALLQVDKISLSYLRYLARENPQELDRLGEDFLSALSAYLETVFIRPKELAASSVSNPGESSSSQPPTTHVGLDERRMRFVQGLRRWRLSEKKCLLLKKHLENGLRLHAMGVISKDGVLMRLALALRKIHIIKLAP